MDLLVTSGPAPPGRLVDRKEETEYIVSRMRSKRINYNVAVIGHRRIGKTSILSKARHELLKKNTAVVYFDVKKNMSEPKTFLTRLQKHIIDAYAEKSGLSARIRAKSNRAVAAFVDIRNALASKRIRGIGVDMTPDGVITPKVVMGNAPIDYSVLFYSVFETANVLSNRRKMRFVIMLDEFQDMGKLRNYNGLKNVFDMFRSVVQERANRVSFVISGSQVHTLAAILGDGSSALFTHFSTLNVGELDMDSSVRLFNMNVKAKRRAASPRIAQEAYSLVGGHPLYLAVLAETWDGKQGMQEALAAQLAEPTGTLYLYCEYMLSEDLGRAIGGPLSRAILRALSGHKDGLPYSGIAKKIAHPMAALPKYLKPLVAADLVTEKDGRFVIRDKVLRRHLELESEGLF